MNLFSSLKRHRFELIFYIILLLNIPIAIRVYQIFARVYYDQDLWLSVATEIYKKLLDPGYTISISAYNLPFNMYYHDINPLFPFLISLLTLLFKDVYTSAVYIAIISNLLLLLVVKKIATEFLHLGKDDVCKLLTIFASTYLAAHYFTIPVEYSLYGLLGTINVYLNLLYFRKPSIKIIIYLCISNTLTLFCHNSIWPMILLPELFLFLLYFAKRNIDYLKRYNYLLNFVVLSIFTTLIPSLIYLGFFIVCNMWPIIPVLYIQFLPYGVTAVWSFPFRFPIDFIVSLFYTITYLWIFVFLAMRKDFRTEPLQFQTNFFSIQERSNFFSIQERPNEQWHKSKNPEINKKPSLLGERLATTTLNQKSQQAVFFDKFLLKIMLYFWFLYYIIYRMVFPGPFFPHFYFPLLFAFSIWIFQGISTLKSSETWFWRIVVVNSILNLTQIFLMAPWYSIAYTFINWQAIF